jgi:hypothetical protein
LLLFAYFFFCFKQKTIRVKESDLHFPNINIAILQLLVASLDYIFVGCVFYFWHW